MSKLFASIENEAGKKASKAGNEYLDIDIYSGNKRIAALTVRTGDDEQVHVYDEFDREIDNSKCDYCGGPMYIQVQGHAHTEGDIPVTEKGYHMRHCKADCPCKWCKKITGTK